jgi:peptide/nickel transport system substrate-binding protein
MNTRLQQGEFVLALQSWRLLNADVDGFGLWHSSQAAAGANYAGVQDREIDELLQEGRTTLDTGERARIYQAFEERWLELMPAVPLFQHVLHYQLDPAVQSAGLDSAGLLVSPSARFRDISAWTVVP